ncbi:MAG TPA: stage II sporulation protein M [bacterium]|jgi:uncharacterized membrane protein SpoIIM required for sporulation
MASELTKFLMERELSYRRLEDLIARAETKGLKGFHREELRELGHLYRLASSDLARARYVLRSPMLTEYLNELVGRAHHLIHRRRQPVYYGIVKFMARDFPVTVRREYRMILLSVALILGAGIVGGIAYSIDNEWGQLVMAQPSLRQYERELTEGPSQLATAIPEDAMLVMSTFIIFNNIRACIVAIAGGFFYGIGTLFALIFNGFLLGVIGNMFITRDINYDLYWWSGILPHGVLEIPAICIAGAGGFLIARGLLVPGKYSRGDALRIEGRTAMILLGGVMVLLLFAGIIEGFITPFKPNIPIVLLQWIKILFAAILFSGFIYYLLNAGTAYQDEDRNELRTTTHLRLD